MPITIKQQTELHSLAQLLHHLCLDISTYMLTLYDKPLEVTFKKDKSPLSKADQYSHEQLMSFLTKQFPDTPILSEEMSSITAYNERKNWDQFWLVDPLDGTKEFIKKNGQFCICIALVEHQKPVFGFIHRPTTNDSYYAARGYGAYKLSLETIKLKPKEKKVNVTNIIGSLSHTSSEFDTYIKNIKKDHSCINVVQMGSALKFCMIAEGTADIYPRFGPTMEWDTAAGQLIAEETGKKVTLIDLKTPLTYNKENLRNPFFIVQ